MKYAAKRVAKGSDRPDLSCVPYGPADRGLLKTPKTSIRPRVENVF